MNDFLRMCFNIITQIGPYLVVLLLLKYLVNLQQKRAKEREEEQKKGIFSVRRNAGWRSSGHAG